MKINLIFYKILFVKKIALIGANGQLGSDIYKVFVKDNFFEIIPLTKEELDITDFDKTKKVLEEINPNIVLNTAAYVRVDEAEDHPQEVFLINTFAQKNLAELCQKNNWVLVYISTDYVFGEDEKRTLPYQEEDKPGPVNIYGLSKLAGEYVTKFICPRYFIIRTCGLFGVAGSSGKGTNIVESLLKIGKKKGEIKVVDDQIVSPTYTKNMAENLLLLLKKGNFGVYHMVSEGECSWYDFACEIFRLLKIKIKCQKIKSNQYPFRAKRPFYSVLENYHLRDLAINRMNHWKKNLKLYLIEKGYL